MAFTNYLPIGPVFSYEFPKLLSVQWQLSGKLHSVERVKSVLFLRLQGVLVNDVIILKLKEWSSH